MSQTVLITSCKGGIGKSTVAANLSMALALSGRKVLVIDCDFRMRCLDLIMGYENEAVFNLYDVIKGKCSLGKALVRDSRTDNLFFLAAPGDRYADVSPEEFEDLIEEIKNHAPDGTGFDYIIIDAPAADDDSLSLSAPVCNRAIIVCSHMPSAIRAAIFTGELLEKYGISDQKLVINSFDAKSSLESSRLGILDMIDSSKIMLIGIVPYDRTLMIYQEKGQLIAEYKKKNNAKVAFENIAKRLYGRHIPLFEGFAGKEYKKILK